MLSLGRIEWIHPGFHVEQYLWPVGFRASRCIATPMSKHQTVVHECEVVQHPDGSGPLFRYMPFRRMVHFCASDIRGYHAQVLSMSPPLPYVQALFTIMCVKGWRCQWHYNGSRVEVERQDPGYA